MISPMAVRARGEQPNPSTADRRAERQAMVRESIEARGVGDPRVLAAMLEIPRHLFVPESLDAQAYADSSLPIGHGATISQPFIVARMSELCDLRPTDDVLEIGTGSGYQAAVLSKLAARVFSIERVPELAVRAQSVLESLGINNVAIKTFDGTYGWSQQAPFDAIVVTAAAPSVPAPLVRQLGVGGRLVIPVGDRDVQQLVRIVRTEGGFREESLGGVIFVPLVGRYGWSSE